MKPRWISDGHGIVIAIKHQRLSNSTSAKRGIPNQSSVVGPGLVHQISLALPPAHQTRRWRHTITLGLNLEAEDKEENNPHREGMTRQL